MGLASLTRPASRHSEASLVDPRAHLCKWRESGDPGLRQGPPDDRMRQSPFGPPLDADFGRRIPYHSMRGFIRNNGGVGVVISNHSDTICLQGRNKSPGGIYRVFMVSRGAG